MCTLLEAVYLVAKNRYECRKLLKENSLNGTVGCVPAFQSEDPGSTLTLDHGIVLGKLFKNTAFPCLISSRTWGLELRCAYGYKPIPNGGFHGLLL